MRYRKWRAGRRRKKEGEKGDIKATGVKEIFLISLAEAAAGGGVRNEARNDLGL